MIYEVQIVTLTDGSRLGRVLVGSNPVTTYTGADEARRIAQQMASLSNETVLCTVHYGQLSLLPPTIPDCTPPDSDVWDG